MRLNDLFEARRNPEVNVDGRLHDRMSSAFGFLSQFKPATGDDPTYFVTFTEIPKVGVNPKSKYKTPIGIYTYPIVPKVILQHSRKELPFAGTENFLSVVQSTVYGGSILMFDEYGSYQNYARDHAKLLRFLEDGYGDQDTKGFLAAAGDSAFEPQIEASRIWNESRWVAAAEANNQTWYGAQTLEDVKRHLIEGTDVPGTPINWNYVLRKILGYQLIIDMDTGTIHQNEPLQALFLSKEALSVVDQRRNQNAAGRGPKHLTMLELYHLLQDNTLSWSEFGNIVDRVLKGQKKSLFRVENVQHYIDTPVGQELDTMMSHIARMHMNKTQASHFQVYLRTWMESDLWFRVSDTTQVDLLTMLIRNTVEHHSNPLVSPGHELNSIANDLRTLLSRFNFKPSEVRAALQHLELDQLVSLIA